MPSSSLLSDLDEAWTSVDLAAHDLDRVRHAAVSAIPQKYTLLMEAAHSCRDIAEQLAMMAAEGEIEERRLPPMIDKLRGIVADVQATTHLGMLRKWPYLMQRHLERAETELNQAVEVLETLAEEA